MCFAVSGRDVEDAVSWLHVHADVQGVLEEDGCQVVWMACAMPELPGRFQVDVVERAVREQDLHVTGLENDTAIHVTEDLLVRPSCWCRAAERSAAPGQSRWCSAAWDQDLR